MAFLVLAFAAVVTGWYDDVLCVLHPADLRQALWQALCVPFSTVPTAVHRVRVPVFGLFVLFLCMLQLFPTEEGPASQPTLHSPLPWMNCSSRSHGGVWLHLGRAHSILRCSTEPLETEPLSSAKASKSKIHLGLPRRRTLGGRPCSIEIAMAGRAVPPMWRHMHCSRHCIDSAGLHSLMKLQSIWIESHQQNDHATLKSRKVVRDQEPIESLTGG
mmetsp:Transcript_117649/g.293300  ORF Transcript_117649/g.293300 Transcript_117649/m.293300 type:complete len:216 (-) Transcript_117649:1227-1874(-)